MKLRITALFVLLFASSLVLHAATALTAPQAYTLSVSSAFQHRLSVLLDAEATVVLRESGATSGHTQRAALAINVLNSPDTYAATLARQLVLDTNLLTAGYTADGNGNPVDSSATDAAIRSQIATNWNIWCGIPQ